MRAPGPSPKRSAHRLTFYRTTPRRVPLGSAAVVERRHGPQQNGRQWSDNPRRAAAGGAGGLTSEQGFSGGPAL